MAKPPTRSPGGPGMDRPTVGLLLLLTYLLQCLSVKWGKQYTMSFYKN